jgi:outer membrane lipoprotein-sorting protein
LKRLFLWLLVSSFLLPGWAAAEEEASRYLDAIEKKYSGLKDYTVDVHVHFDMDTFKAPDMQARLYFKAPDKMKIESKKVFFFPKEGGYFNPGLFKKEDFEIKLLEPATEGGTEVRLKMVPKRKEMMGREFVLKIDPKDSLVKEMAISQVGGREARAGIEYERVGSFELPKHISLTLEFPFMESSETRGFESFEPKSNRTTGKIEITYSNYKVNTGLEDVLFKSK